MDIRVEDFFHINNILMTSIRDYTKNK